MKRILLWLLVIGALSGCAPRSSPGSLPQEFRVVTFNVHNSEMNDTGARAWAQRRPIARSMLMQLDADIMGLQEVSSEQRQDLDYDLIGYRSVGQGRLHDGQGEQCPIYSRQDLTIEAEGMFWLSPTPLEPSIGWDAQLPRICTWIRYPGLSVFNAHLDHLGTESRRQSLLLIRRLSKGSAVIMGDFNDREGSPALQPVGDLIDAFRALHPSIEPRKGNTFRAFDKGRRTGQRIDFVFITPDLQPLQAELVRARGRVRPSDHRALTVRLKRRNSI